MQVIIKQAKTKKDCEAIARTAYDIWMQHYAPIVSEEQIRYMLEKYQSADVIYVSIHDDHRYYMAYDGETLTGYCGIQFQEGAVYLSKLYIRKDYRRQGIARAFLKTIRALAMRHGAGSIWLNVNKGNEGSIAAYQALGFYIECEDVDEIGSGFVKDDYIMRYDLPKEEKPAQ